MIQREHISQTRLREWVRDAVAAPHVFMSFDRGKASGKFTHMRQKARGVLRGTADTLLRVEGFPPLWAEWKAKGGKPDEAQLDFGARVQAVGDRWGWFTSVNAYRLWLVEIGVPLHPNAEFLALHADARAETTIAKAEVKRKAFKPRKPSGASMKRQEALRAKVMF